MLKTLYIVVEDCICGCPECLGAFDDQCDAQEFALSVAEEDMYYRFLRLSNDGAWPGHAVECARYCHKYLSETDITVLEVPYYGS